MYVLVHLFGVQEWEYGGGHMIFYPSTDKRDEFRILRKSLIFETVNKETKFKHFTVATCIFNSLSSMYFWYYLK